MALEQEIATYNAQLPKLLPDNNGKFVLIQGNDVAGIYSTYEDAIQVGYEPLWP